MGDRGGEKENDRNVFGGSGIVALLPTLLPAATDILMTLMLILMPMPMLLCVFVLALNSSIHFDKRAHNTI